MILLDTAAEAITWDSAASLIGTGATLVGGIAYVINSRAKIKEMEIKHEGDVNLLRQEVLSQKEQKGMVLKALRKDLDDKHQVAMDRIDKTQTDMKKDREENQKEFKQINQSLNQILGILQNQNN